MQKDFSISFSKTNIQYLFKFSLSLCCRLPLGVRITHCKKTCTHHTGWRHLLCTINSYTSNLQISNLQRVTSMIKHALKACPFRFLKLINHHYIYNPLLLQYKQVLLTTQLQLINYRNSALEFQLFDCLVALFYFIINIDKLRYIFPYLASTH